MNSESPQITFLRSQYKDSLSLKAEVISQHMNVLTDFDSSNKDELVAIRNDLHKFAGSSGMYGYSDIASMAREAMLVLDAKDDVKLHYKLIDLRNLLLQHAKS